MRKAQAKDKRCGSAHPLHGTQVRCDSPVDGRGNHLDYSAEHFNCFYMRLWDVEDAPRAQRRAA